LPKLRDRIKPGVRPVPLGLRRETLGDSALFVLPNPSGRNANFSYTEMLAAFKSLRKFVKRATEAQRHRG